MRLRAGARWVARRTIRLALRPAAMKRLVRAELADRKQEAPAPAPGDGARAFVDRYGVRHQLDPGLRDRLKPGWRSMLDQEDATRPPSDEALQRRAASSARVVRDAVRLVDEVLGVRLTGRILEVGCYDGALAFQLAGIAGSEVVASDLARYYVVQRPGAIAEREVVDQQAVLASLRERARAVAGVAPGRVRFVEDDITASELEPGSFDAIVSTEVLEHVRRPRVAFREMGRLLRPGGVAYHDYNPFFAINGGHSLCTLDFPWGHSRLDDADFERYLVELRPDEAEQALRFYRESLNRMTVADLRSAIAEAGLELLAVLPWHDRSLVRQLSPGILSEVRRSYPSAAAEDLLGTFVTVVARQPASTSRTAR